MSPHRKKHQTHFLFILISCVTARHGAHPGTLCMCVDGRVDGHAQLSGFGKIQRQR